MMSGEQERAKLADLVLEIKKAGSSWDELAAFDAIAFARNPDDPKAREKANRTVAKADVSNKLANEIIDIVRRYWSKR